MDGFDIEAELAKASSFLAEINGADVFSSASQLHSSPPKVPPLARIGSSSTSLDDELARAESFLERLRGGGGGGGGDVTERSGGGLKPEPQATPGPATLSARAAMALAAKESTPRPLRSGT